MRYAHVTPPKLAHQLHVVVAGYAQADALRRHRHSQTKHVGRLRPAVDQVAEKDGLSSRRVRHREGCFSVGPPNLVAERFEQSLELVEAAVYVPDEVEGPVVRAAVVPERLPLDGRSLDRLRRIEDEDVPEPLALKLAEGTAELLHLLPQDVWPEGAVGASRVAISTDLLVHIENDRDGERVKLASQGDERLPRLGLHVRGIDDREKAAREPLIGDEVQDLEGIARGRLVILVIGDQATACVRREDLRGLEVLAREGRLARARRAHEHNERKLRDGEGLRHVELAALVPISKMAI